MFPYKAARVTSPATSAASVTSRRSRDKHENSASHHVRSERTEVQSTSYTHRPHCLSQKLGEILSFQNITSCDYFRCWGVRRLVSSSTALFPSSLGNPVVVAVLTLACQLCRQKILFRFSQGCCKAVHGQVLFKVCVGTHSDQVTS